MSAPVRVMVVDDHWLTRAGIRCLLAAHTDMTLVAEAGAGSEILPLVEAHCPDVLLLDLRLPDKPDSVETGFDIVSTLAHLRQHYPYMRVIIITQCDGGLLARAVLRIGVQGYLLKDDAITAHLVEAIRTVMAGNLFFSQRIRQFRNGTKALLTERQVEVLNYLAAHPEMLRCAVACQLGISPIRSTSICTTSTRRWAYTTCLRR